MTKNVHKLFSIMRADTVIKSQRKTKTKIKNTLKLTEIRY